MGLQSSNFLRHFSLHDHHGAIDRFLDVAEATLPHSSLISIAAVLRSHHKEEVLIICLFAIATVDQSCVVTHDSKLRLQTVLSLVLDNASESITHYSDEHVEEGELGDDSCRQEEDVAQGHLWMVIEAIHCELSN